MDPNVSRSRFSCIVIDAAFQGDETGHSRDIVSGGIEPFADMVLSKLLQDHNRESDECMGIGLSADDRLMLLMDKAAHHLRTSSGYDQTAIERDVKKKLKAFAVKLWFQSHHRN